MCWVKARYMSHAPSLGLTFAQVLQCHALHESGVRLHPESRSSEPCAQSFGLAPFSVAHHGSPKIRIEPAAAKKARRGQ